MSTLNETMADIFAYLKVKKDLGQLLLGDNSLIKLYNPETHRLHGKVDSLGANTARCTHSLPNITQLPRDPEFRKLLCVPKDKLLVDVDADALTSRASKRD